jgi:hypothetical protein
MKKIAQKPARDTVPANALSRAVLQRVRGGATAIEYGLIAAPGDASSTEPK